MTNGEMATVKGTRDGRQKEKSRAQSILLVTSIHQLLNIISILNCLKKTHTVPKRFLMLEY